MKKRNRILVIDVESTCWESDKEQRKNVSEIIEIGITELVRENGAWEITETQSLPIKPMFSKVSEFCTELTGWTQAELEKRGMSYVQAVKYLKSKFDSKNAIVACWGKYDDKMFQEMSKMHKTGYPFNNDYLNVKALYGVKFGKVVGVEQALNDFGMKFEGRPHNGGDDSRNIARLLLKLTQEEFHIITKPQLVSVGPME